MTRVGRSLIQPQQIRGETNLRITHTQPRPLAHLHESSAHARACVRPHIRAETLFPLAEGAVLVEGATEGDVVAFGVPFVVLFFCGGDELSLSRSFVAITTADA